MPSSLFYPTLLLVGLCLMAGQAQAQSCAEGVDRDHDGVDCPDDCDDFEANSYPGAPELCDGLDNDCNGKVDNGAPCPGGCVVKQRQGNAYMLCTDALNWSDAKDACYHYGYHLLTLNNADEANWVDGKIDEISTGKWWMGLNDHNDEGNFTWEDGDPSGYRNWADGEPNNTSTDEDCVQLNRYHPELTWNDEPCHFTLAYVCEFGGLTRYFRDADGDEFGDGNVYQWAKTAPEGFVETPLDCDDDDFDINPQADEVQDGVDNDCDGQIDEGFETPTFPSPSPGTPSDPPPTPSAMPSPSPSQSAAPPSPTPLSTMTQAPTATASPTAMQTLTQPSPTEAPTASQGPTLSPTMEATQPSPSPLTTASPGPTGTMILTPTQAPSPTATALTATPSPQHTPTQNVSPSAAPTGDPQTPGPTQSQGQSPNPSATPLATATPWASESPMPTFTKSPELTAPSPTLSPSPMDGSPSNSGSESPAPTVDGGSPTIGPSPTPEVSATEDLQPTLILEHTPTLPDFETGCECNGNPQSRSKGALGAGGLLLLVGLLRRRRAHL